ncbi:MAG: porin family protein [Bacteroidota bacterium]
MRFFLNSLILLIFSSVFSQEVPDFKALDSLYREDQFYVGISYNTLRKTPIGITEGKFTPSYSIGFQRDMPINKARNKAIALGLGYAINNYNQNILITKSGDTPIYSFPDAGTSYDKNKLTLHYIEIPLEYRWRTSTPDTHIFWRIYTGFKLSYLVYDRSKYASGSDKIIVTNNKDLNSWQYGLYMAAGRNTWNFHLYYGLNPIFKSAELNGKSIDMNTLNFGLMFYIL